MFDAQGSDDHTHAAERREDPPPDILRRTHQVAPPSPEEMGELRHDVEELRHEVEELKEVVDRTITSAAGNDGNDSSDHTLSADRRHG